MQRNGAVVDTVHALEVVTGRGDVGQGIFT